MPTMEEKLKLMTPEEREKVYEAYDRAFERTFYKVIGEVNKKSEVD